jgi:hypothetical protein
MIGFAMHNTAYRVTVQWRYGVYMKGPRGPFQTSITIYVQNLVVTSPDETKVLKWDPVREIADTSFSYSLECAQRKWCQVKVSIYSTDGMKVYEEWLEKLAPGSYSFTWDGSVNVVPPPPDGKAPAGLYVFDLDVIGIAPGYDEDCLRSRALRVGEHAIEPLALHLYEARYILRSGRDASEAWVEVYDPQLQRIAGPASGPTHAIFESAVPRETDWNSVRLGVELQYASDQPYRFVFWARDNFPDYDKAHRKKVALTNQGVIDLGWCLSAGFNFKKHPNAPWSRWVAVELDSTAIANEIISMVQRVAVLRRQGVILQGFYKRHVELLPGRQKEDLLYTYEGGAVTFKDKINKALQTGQFGLISYVGHGGHGKLIGFPTQDPENEKWLFGITSSPDCIGLDQLPPLGKIKVVYLGACYTCTDKYGTGLPQAFVQRGAHAAVGWHVDLRGVYNHLRNTHITFWKVLVGDISAKRPGGTVSEAAKAAGEAYRSRWDTVRGYQWYDYVGIAGNAAERLY